MCVYTYTGSFGVSSFIALCPVLMSQALTELEDDGSFLSGWPAIELLGPLDPVTGLGLQT